MLLSPACTSCSTTRAPHHQVVTYDVWDNIHEFNKREGDYDAAIAAKQEAIRAGYQSVPIPDADIPGAGRGVEHGTRWLVFGRRETGRFHPARIPRHPAKIPLPRPSTNVRRCSGPHRHCAGDQHSWSAMDASGHQLRRTEFGPGRACKAQCQPPRWR